MLPVSVCIIAKNEASCIDECLKRLARYDWEIIVVDTGSTDCTMEIARKYTPYVYSFTWIDDFSAARNYSISKATNDYILVLDCDEYLEEEEHTAQTILTLPTYITPNQVGVFVRHSPTAVCTDTASSPQMTTEHIVRFFHKEKMHFEGRIHEQVVGKSGEPKSFVSIPLSFYHVGYETALLQEQKASRNITLLEYELEKHPNNPYLYYQLGRSYFSIGNYAKALPCFETTLSMELDEQAEYVQNLVESYGYCLLYLKQYQKALELEGIYSIFCKNADFVFLMGLIYMNNALFTQAIEEFQKATTISSYCVEGVNSYSANYNIGVIYECMGNHKEAIAYYSKCGTYAPALQRLQLLDS
ncbi:MAG: glycosyltransferase [Lachnospiraceae bacterium]|nr:glycosyltransferase [Lachnospiraceae bacterium]